MFMQLLQSSSSSLLLDYLTHASQDYLCFTSIEIFLYVQQGMLEEFDLSDFVSSM